MTQVQILEDCKGTQDGHTIMQFTKGQTVEIRESLARQFFKEKKAEKTIEQIHEEWNAALNQESDVWRNVDIKFIEEGLIERGDDIGLRYFRRLQLVSDIERSMIKAIENL